MDVFENLIEQQIKAVSQIDGPMLVLAGAGSGKTTVLVRRIIYMIDQGIAPDNILAITFSHKAAMEMRSRVIKNVPDNLGRNVKVKTFHALCADILRNEKEALGTYIFHREVPGFVICNSDDCLSAVQEALEKNHLAGLPELTAEGILERINRVKNEGVSVDAFREQWLITRNFVDDVFLKVYREYQAILQKNLCLDFNDLIMYVLELFEKCPEILKKYQERYRYIMVDEYQDTNTAQFELIRLLAGKYQNLCVVGDDDQSIYKFRGANIYNILNFEKHFPDAKTIKLEQNYRSTQNILNAANSVIANNVGRKSKTLWTANDEGKKIDFEQFNTGYEEADYIARDIAGGVRNGDYHYGDYAVLYRTNAQSRLFEERFIVSNIPYKIVGGVNFYARKEVKDLLAYLKLSI